MKNCIVAIMVAVVLISCGDKKSETSKNDEVTSVDTSFVKTPENNNNLVSEFKRGAELIEASDCLACHKVNEKLVGPSYEEVAAKYTSKDEAMLAKKIVEGGTGNWGEIPMTAHAGISIDDATEMVKYILSLK